MALASKVKDREIRKMPRVKLKVRKGDTVMVISGKDKGKRGVIEVVNPIKQTVLVEGLNLMTKHQKGRQGGPGAGTGIIGGLIKKPAPLHVSKVMLIDPKTDKPTRVGRRVLEDGKIVRFAKATGEIIETKLGENDGRKK